MLWEPWEVAKDDGTPYKVFTPYFRRGCTKKGEAHPSEAQSTPQHIAYAPFSERSNVESLNLLPKIAWYTSFEQHWTPGEKGAQKHRQDQMIAGKPFVVQQHNHNEDGDEHSGFSHGTKEGHDGKAFD